MTFQNALAGVSAGSVPVLRVQDARDVDVTLAAGEDGKALFYDHDTGNFVLDVASSFSIVVDAAGGGDYTTLATALAAASAGDGIFVKDGTYAGGITISLDGVTLRGESRDGVIVQSPADAVTPAITVSGHKVTIDGIKIDGRRDLQTSSGTGDVGAQNYSAVYVTGDDVTIRNSWIFEPRGMGIVGASGADRGTIINCRVENRATNGTAAVSGAYSYGVLVTGTTARWQITNSTITGWSQGVGLWFGAQECVIAYNRIIDNYGYLDEAHTLTRSAVEDYGSTATHGRNVWAYNVIDGSTSCCIECAQGVDGSQFVGNVLRNYNKFGDNTGSPFTIVDGGAGERTKNILVKDNRVYGSDVQGFCMARGANITIEGNSFEDFTNAALTSGVLLADTAITTGLRIVNNRFVNCRGGVYLHGSVGNGAVVFGNSFSSPVSTTIPFVQLLDGSGHVVSNNYMDANSIGVPGIRADTAGGGHIITGNTCVGFTSHCIDIKRGNCQVTHNYLVSTNTFGVIQLSGSNALYNNVRWNYCNCNNEGRTIYLASSAASNNVQENWLIGAAAGVYDSATWVAQNSNIITPNSRNTTLIPMAGLNLGSKTVGASEATIAHGLPWIPREIRIIMTSTGTVWKSSTSNATNIFLTADDADRTCEVWVV